jgi:hypothetical protein
MCAVASRRLSHGPGEEDLRPDDIAGPHAVSHRCHDIQRAAHVPHVQHTRLDERLQRGAHRVRTAQREEAQVDVAVPEAGQRESAGGIDLLIWPPQFGGRPHRVDAAVADQDPRGRRERAGRGVEEAQVRDQETGTLGPSDSSGRRPIGSHPRHRHREGIDIGQPLPSLLVRERRGHVPGGLVDAEENGAAARRSDLERGGHLAGLPRGHSGITEGRQQQDRRVRLRSDVVHRAHGQQRPESLLGRDRTELVGVGRAARCRLEPNGIEHAVLNDDARE